MTYWWSVTQRAAKEALGDLRLGLVPVALSFITQAIIGLVLYAFLRDASPVTRLASALAPFLAVPLIFGFRMFTVPAAMDGELQRQVSELSPDPRYTLPAGYTLLDDTRLEDALAFAVTGSWSLVPDYDGPDLTRLEGEVEAFMRLARGDRLRVWYKPYRRDPQREKLEATGWAVHRINFLDVARGNAVLVKRQDDARVETCFGLWVCKAEWEAPWKILREFET